jgi:hypothetical protein
MRIEQENPSKNEATFKASKKTKPNSNPNCSCSNDLDKDEEISNFVQKLKRGTGKYKGILALKCFNYGRITYFYNNCPYSKKSESDEE